MIQRPDLTLPAAEAALLAADYAAAGTILEYGSGGSTVLGAEMAGKRVFSVESDRDWAQKMQGWFTANPPAGQVSIHHVDIGPTKQWGHPADDSGFRNWPAYPFSVWDRADFVHPDVVLVDGRFRGACLVATALRITRPVVALFDDYRNRKPYHVVEELVRPVSLTGRMARFELVPTELPPARLQWLAGLCLRPL